MGRGRRQKPQSRLNNQKTEWIPAGLGFALFLPYFLCVLAGRIHAGFHLAAPAGDASDQLSEPASLSPYPDD